LLQTAYYIIHYLAFLAKRRTDLTYSLRSRIAFIRAISVVLPSGKTLPHLKKTRPVAPQATGKPLLELLAFRT